MIFSILLRQKIRQYREKMTDDSMIRLHKMVKKMVKKRIKHLQQKTIFEVDPKLEKNHTVLYSTFENDYCLTVCGKYFYNYVNKLLDLEKSSWEILERCGNWFFIGEKLSESFKALGLDADLYKSSAYYENYYDDPSRIYMEVKV